MGVEGISNANLLEETDWREKALNLTFNNRGNWNSSTSYNYLDQVNYWDMTWVLLYADSVPSGSDDPYHWSGSNNPWVDKSVYDSMTKLTKWSVSANGRRVWLVPNAYRRMTAVHLKKNGSTTSALTQTISNPIVARETYTMSLYYRAKNNLHLFMTHLIDTSANITDTYGVSGVAIINGHAVALNATDVSTGVTLQANPILPSTNWSWRFISITFIAKSSDSYQFALHGFTANTECEATMLKLEKGASATPWTDMGDVLKKSGIDIYAEKIVATTDNFEVHNSSGTKTFGIDPNGNIEAIGNASFKGNVEATSFISNNGSFVARNSDGNNVFWIDSNGDGWISGMLRAKTIYNSILNLVLVSADFGTGTTFPKTRSYSDIMDRRKQMTNPLPYLTYLPDFLIISTTDKKTGTEANPDPRYYNVTLPSASSCEGKMVEVHLYHRLLVDQSSTAHNVGLRVTFSNYTYPDGLSGETAYYQLEQSHTEAKKARFRILSTGSQWLILDEEGVTLNSTM